MSDINGPGDDLILPFIFVPHGSQASPELEEYKARHPGWFTIPATFEPHGDAGPRDEAPPPPAPPPSQDSPGRWGRLSEPPNHARCWGSDLAAASGAFQRANALLGDPVAALRALRDSPETPTDVPDDSIDVRPSGQSVPGAVSPLSGRPGEGQRLLQQVRYASADPDPAVEKEPIGIDVDEQPRKPTESVAVRDYTNSKAS